MELKRLSHACFKINGNGLIIYIDPYNLKEPDQADLILITHDHYDHCSINDIEKIRTDNTIIIASIGCSISGDVRHMNPGDKIVVKGIEIEAVSAYNIGKPFHPKEKRNLGYIITIEGKRIYHAGDTDLISEMNSITCDIALLPVSGTYVMTAQEAAKAADMIRPSLVAIPMHYGSGVVGTTLDAENFEKNTGIHVAFDTYNC
jgi:L-ascorbate metabolism protein UlaG (beta-lactamase superfamily)